MIYSEGKRPIERPRCRWEANLKMDFKRMGWGVEWVDLAHDRDSWRALFKAVMNFCVP
jgi:hypothetical protein